MKIKVYIRNIIKNVEHFISLSGNIKIWHEDKEEMLIRIYYPTSFLFRTKIMCTIEKLYFPKGKILTRFFKYEKGN